MCKPTQIFAGPGWRKGLSASTAFPALKICRGGEVLLSLTFDPCLCSRIERRDVRAIAIRVQTFRLIRCTVVRFHQLISWCGGMLKLACCTCDMRWSVFAWETSFFERRPGSYSVGTGSHFSWKRRGQDVKLFIHQKVENMWSCTYILTYVFMARV